MYSVTEPAGDVKDKKAFDNVISIIKMGCYCSKILGQCL